MIVGYKDVDAPERRDRRARARLSSRTASCTTRAAPAPATRRRPRAICGRSCSRCAATRRRSARFPPEERGRKGIWVEPKLVAEIDFRGWTAQRHVRHAAFKGLREDKPAQRGRAGDADGRRKRRNRAPEHRRRRRARSARRRRNRARRTRPVKFTHPDRVYWTDVEITKQQLADYYTSVWDVIAPHLVRRPLALVRCPEGVGGQCFFQKHAAAGLDQRAHPPPQGQPRRGADLHRGPRRAAHAGAGRRAGDPCLGLDHRRCRALQPHRVRPRSRRRREMGRREQGRARIARAARRTQARRAS